MQLLHAKQANSDKIRTFRRVPLFDALVRGKPFTHRLKILAQETRVCRAAQRGDFVILACTVLIQSQSAMDKYAGRQTLRPWLRHTKHSAVAHKNNK